MKPATAAAIVAAATAAIYWPALHAGFVGDDFMILHRLRDLTGPADVSRFFRGEFFEYYRPIGFLAHAADWAVAGADPRQFHLTNLLLHAASTLIVLLIGVRLAPGTPAGFAAALLFALHASNHEAVVWVSARFDLLATFFSLAALWWMVREGAAQAVVPPLLFLLAVLSKESAVALPVAAASYLVFQRRAGTAETIRRLAPWLAALAAYAVLRSLGGGVSPIGGASRLPKLAAFASALLLLLLLADGRWLRVRAWLRERRTIAACAMLLAVGLAAGAAAANGGAGLAADKLAVAGFALFHLASPVLDVFDRTPFYQDAGTAMYWLGGAIALAAVAALAWRTLLDDGRVWFLGGFLLAALIPISALTEGARYLYLPSAAVSLLCGVLLADTSGALRRGAIAAVVIFVAVSAGQIALKVRDWNWAGRLTAQGSALVDASLAPACGGDVIFLTAPVAIRGVYTHFYYETFELPRGCMPETFQILARVVRQDAAIVARWTDASSIEITAPDYRGNLVFAADLRHFDRPLREAGPIALTTPLGDLRGERSGRALRLTLTLAAAVLDRSPRIFYYSEGRILALAK
ncbi:MAG TPA: hypothetical protein VFK57_19360 [Vicinamibacterales bacterium]|nr:hypothetical protein [Vicinamibacterales bacterium]